MRFTQAAKRVGRTAPALGLIGALVWIATAVVAGVCYQSFLQRSRASTAIEEILGYVAAFAVAGTLSGMTALSMRGRGKIGSATFLWLLILLGVAGAVLLTHPNVPWLWSAYTPYAASRRVGGALAAGLRLGLPAGLAVAVCVVAVEPFVRRGSRWALGVAVAFGALVATGRGINDAVAWVTRMGLGESWQIHRELVWGSACGAIIGALAAALLGEAAGWFASHRRPQATKAARPQRRAAFAGSSRGGR